MNLQKVNTLKLSDSGYPAMLKNIDQPPERLFWSGTAPHSWLSQPRIAIVGSRKASNYGRVVTEKLASQLAGRGVVIISGLALGIDSIAHQATLEAGGCTVAVLPTPLDNIYPASHLNLALRITSGGGTIISEYPSDSVIFRVNFIARNRIVSGLADVLLITEAAVNSGTLHTARFALDQGKTVMAVPGNINQPGSEGCNNLIKSGAVPVTAVDDVLFALGISPTKKARPLNRAGFSQTEKTLLDLIADGLADQDELALACKLGGAQLGSALTSLEIAGAVRPEGAGRWVIA